MRLHKGRVKEIRLDADGQPVAWIECPFGAIPAAGQYVRAHNIDEDQAVLSAWLFPGEINAGGFLTLPPIPESWVLGAHLELWGPLGKGFKLPERLGRMALAAFGDTMARLLPLIDIGMQLDCSVTLFTDVPQVHLHSSLEVYPLSLLPEALDWPQFLALDVPVECFPRLRAGLGLEPGQDPYCPAQVLVYTQMPCAGLADCGICAVSARRGWKLACKDGPVFDLDQLEW
jgi:NAD(P)H-flavin reductase